MADEPLGLVSVSDEAPEESRSGAAQQKARRLDAAEDDLAWLFTGAAAAIGFSAQSIEGGGGGLVWDDARIAALHLRMRTPERRRVAQKFQRIGLAAAAMRPEDFELARLFYSTRRLPPELRIAFKVRDWNIATLCATHSASARSLRDRKRPELGIYEFLVWECVSLNAKSKKLPPRLLRIREEGEALVEPMVARFADVLEERDAIIARERAHDEDLRQRRLRASDLTRPPPRSLSLDEKISAMENLYESMVFGPGSTA